MNAVVAVLLWLLTAALPVGAGLSRIWVHTEAVQLGYALSAAERRHEAANAALRALEVEVAAARSPARLMQLGRALGLRPAQPDERRYALSPARLARADAAVGRGRP